MLLFAGFCEFLVIGSFSWITFPPGETFLNDTRVLAILGGTNLDWVNRVTLLADNVSLYAVILINLMLKNNKIWLIWLLMFMNCNNLCYGIIGYTGYKMVKFIKNNLTMGGKQQQRVAQINRQMMLNMMIQVKVFYRQNFVKFDFL